MKLFSMSLRWCNGYSNCFENKSSFVFPLYNLLDRWTEEYSLIANGHGRKGKKEKRRKFFFSFSSLLLVHVSFISINNLFYMTTKTTIILSPIRRPYTSPKLKKRRMSSSSIFTQRKSRTIITLSYRLDLQQQRETISHIAMILRNIGDQIEEEFRIDQSSNDFFGQRTRTFLHCFSTVLRWFL